LAAECGTGVGRRTPTRSACAELTAVVAL